jgi:NADPH-dependent glutamate synthase beta subunit-like oxidoreductase
MEWGGTDMTRMQCIDPEKIIPISRSTTEVFQTGAWATRRPLHQEKVSSCRAACPAGNNITQALLKASQGDFDGALSAFLEESPLPGVCGRVCYHPCQTACNRGQWDGEVSIRALERAASEMGNARPSILSQEGEGHPVAVVGSGPAGLSAAYHLARMGHPVTVLEADDEVGGLLRWGIPPYRLPRHVLERDVERVVSLGIQVRTNTRVEAREIVELQKTHEAVFIAAGAQKGLSLEIPGVGLEGVVLGIEFLRDIRRDRVGDVSGKVVVIGGGNVAVDAALTACKLGADQVELVCLEQEDEMPAHEGEREDAMEEGVVFYHGWGPRRILEKDNRVSGVEFVGCTSLFDKDGKFSPSYDESSTLIRDADRVIVAIGQAPDISFLEASDFFDGAQGGLPVNVGTMETSAPGIFAGGDLVRAAGSVVDAIAAGKQAALAIHMRSLGRSFDEEMAKVRLGDGPSFSIDALFHARAGWNPHSVVKFEDLEPLFLDYRAQVELPRLDAVLRKKNFEEINLSLKVDDAIRAAERCFFCGTCTQCDRCFIYCPELSISPPDENRAAYEADPKHCKGCAVCEAVCPRGVMKMREDI